MLHALRPGHLADVDQSLDALLELDEGAIVSDADHASAYVRTDRITMRRVKPGVGSELFESQRHALFVLIEFQHFDLYLIAYVHQIPRMCQAAPRHVGDMQQAINSAKVHERAILGQ